MFLVTSLPEFCDDFGRGPLRNCAFKNSQPFGKNVRKFRGGGFFDSHCIQRVQRVQDVGLRRTYFAICMYAQSYTPR